MMMLIYCVSVALCLLVILIVWTNTEEDVRLNEVVVYISLSLTPIINTVVLVAGVLVFIITIEDSGVMDFVVIRGKKNE